MTDNPRLSKEERVLSVKRVETWLGWIEYAYREALNQGKPRKDLTIEIIDGKRARVKD